jgi:signal transduction histidine kinase
VGPPHPRTIILGAVYAVGAFTLAAAVVTIDPLNGEQLTVAGGLLAASLLAERFPVVIHRLAAGSTSLATIFLSTLAVVVGWQAAVIAGAITMGTVELIRRKRRVAMAYNISLYVLAAAAAGLVSHELLPESARIGLAAPTAFWLVNITLLAAIVAANDGRNFPRVWGAFIAHTSVPFVVMAALTGVLVALHDGRGAEYMLLLAPPLVALAIYQSWTARLLQRRDELDRLKDEIVAVVSHELRTPLASVSGAAMTLQRSDLRADYRERLLAMMAEEAKRLNRLIDEVLWASMSERGLAPRIAPIDAGELARTAAEEAATVAPDGLFVHGSGWGTALGDEAQVRRVLSTLLENAIKYSPDGGEVRVAAAVRDGVVRFTVSDEGIGIPEPERERVFEKFHRLDPQMLHGIGGTGLGLYIARRLLERMGGSIWIEPNGTRGTTVVFELPSQGGPIPTQEGSDEREENRLAVAGGARVVRGDRLRSQRMEVGQGLRQGG